MTRRRKGPDSMLWFPPEPSVDIENFDLGEMVRFDLDFPTDPRALINDPRLQRIYQIYLEKLDGIRDFAGRDKLKRDMVGLLQSVNNFETMIPLDSEYRRTAHHSLAVIVLTAYALGTLSSSDDKAAEKLHDIHVKRGRKGGRVNIEKAASTWHPQATLEAKRFRTELPGITQPDLANNIVDLWKGDGKCPVGYHAMLKFIAKLEKGGVLPRAVRARRRS